MTFLFARLPRMAVVNSVEAVGAHAHAFGERRLLGGERVGGREPGGAHGDLVLLGR